MIPELNKTQVPMVAGLDTKVKEPIQFKDRPYIVVAADEYILYQPKYASKEAACSAAKAGIKEDGRRRLVVVVDTHYSPSHTYEIEEIGNDEI